MAGSAAAVRMKDYRVESRVKNNRLLSRIEAAGYKSSAEFCRAFGLNANLLSAVICMRVPAVAANGQWRPIAQDIAAALHCNPEDLFNARQAAGRFAQRVIRHEVDEDTLALNDMTISERAALPPPQESADARIDLEKLMVGLTVRERRAVELLSGLSGEGEVTLEDVGQEFGVSGVRARQIWGKAVRKMRKAAGVKGSYDGTELSGFIRAA